MDFSFGPPPGAENLNFSTGDFGNVDFFGNGNGINTDTSLGGQSSDVSSMFPSEIPPPPGAAATSQTSTSIFDSINTSNTSSSVPQFGFLDPLLGGGSTGHDSNAAGQPGIPRLDTSDAIRGNMYASANEAGYGNGTTEKENLNRQFLRQRMLGRLAKWQDMGLLENCLVEDHDFRNKDLVRTYSFEYVKEIFEYYRLRKDTQMYTDLITTTFRETASNLENYLVKQHDYRSFQGITNKIEEDYELYHDDFEEYGETLSELKLPTYVVTGLRLAKTVAGIIAANAALHNVKTTPRRLRTAMAINPNLEKEFYRTHLDVMTNGGTVAAAARAAQAASEEYEDAAAVQPPSKRRKMAGLSMAERLALREEDDRQLANMMNRQPAPDAPRPPPPVDTRTLEPSEDPVLQTASSSTTSARPPMRGLQAVEREMNDFENQIDVDGIFANSRHNATNLDFNLSKSFL